MNTNKENPGAKFSIKLFIYFTLASLTLLITIMIIGFYSIQISTQKFFQGKLSSISAIFVSSFQESLKSNNNPDISFIISSQIIEKIDHIRFIRLWSMSDKRLMASFPVNNPNLSDPSFSKNFFDVIKLSNSTYAKLETVFTYGEKQFMVEMYTPIDDIETIIHEAYYYLTLIITIFFFLSIPVLNSLANKIFNPIRQLYSDIKKLRSKSPSAWRQINQYKHNSFLNDFIISINELIFRTQRSLVCQENLGRFLTHEINAPLTNLLNEIELSKNIFNSSDDFPNEQKNIFCNQAIHDVLRIRSIVNNISDLANTNTTEYYEEMNTLSELITSSVLEFERIYKSTVKLENRLKNLDSVVHINGDYFWILLSNILRNSLEHGNGHIYPPTVRISDIENYYKLELMDDGPGFPFSKKIIELIKSEDGPEQLLKAYGAGMVLCLKLSEIMNIDVSFRNRSPHGAIVTILIPTTSNSGVKHTSHPTQQS